MDKHKVEYYRTASARKKGVVAHTWYVRAENQRQALDKLENAKRLANYRGVWVVYEPEAEEV